jgi:hypothetical protein
MSPNSIADIAEKVFDCIDNKYSANSWGDWAVIELSKESTVSTNFLFYLNHNPFRGHLKIHMAVQEQTLAFCSFAFPLRFRFFSGVD